MLIFVPNISMCCRGGGDFVKEEMRKNFENVEINVFKPIFPPSTCPGNFLCLGHTISKFFAVCKF
jgi:hypothetical protein